MDTNNKAKCYNEEFIVLMEKLNNIMSKHGEPFRARAYQKAQESIMTYPNDLISVDQVKDLPGIGATIMDKLKEYVETGTLRVLEQDKTNPINILTDIYGVGPKKAEELVAKGFDKIITVADEMGEYFVKKYLLKTDSVQTINNGFDYDDFRVNHNHTSNHTIVFTGTLYEKALDSFLIFFNQLNTLKTEYTFHFYGEVHESILPYFKGSDKLFYHEKIALNLVYEKIAESDACLLFLTDDLTFSFSTKFVEYLSQNKPILVFSKPGKTGEFVNQNKLGFQMDNSNLNDVLNLLKNNNPSTYEISSFDVKNLTYKLIDLLN